VDVDVDLLRSLHLPATLCLTAGKDCLKFEAIEYTNKLEAAGIEVAKHEYPDAIHGFSHHKDYAEDREDCWRRVQEFLRERLI
jgi:acetyl esterase